MPLHDETHIAHISGAGQVLALGARTHSVALTLTYQHIGMQIVMDAIRHANDNVVFFAGKEEGFQVS
jgi:hypothetical protein